MRNGCDFRKVEKKEKFFWVKILIEIRLRIGNEFVIGYLDFVKYRYGD